MEYSPTARRIIALLTAGLQAEVTLVDESHKHAGHAGAKGGGGHYFVHIKTNAFTGKNLLARQRMVYAILEDMMKKEIHALSMKCDVL
jgi:BolA family transcriptional regulator, general stress-responsive regulator